MNILRRILILMGLACSIYCLCLSYTFSVPIWLLPLTFSLGMLACRNIICKNTPGILTLLFLMFLRYVFTPFVYYTDGVINTMVLNLNHLQEALFLMLYELVAIFITLEITGKRDRARFCSMGNYVYKYDFHLNKNLLFLFAVVIVLGYIAASYKSLGQGLDAFVRSSYHELDDIESHIDQGKGYINIVWQSLYVWLYVVLVMKEKNANDKYPSIKHVTKALVYTIVLVILTFIDSTGVTRWYTFVSAIASLSCLISFFPSHKKSILVVLVVPLAALMVFSSLVKNGGYEKGATSVSESAEGTFGATNLDVYCNGLGNVNAVFEINNLNVDIDLTTIVVDVLRSCPVINHYIPKEKSSTAIYHRVVGRNDQILPLVGQSYLYFGLFLSPLLSILIICLLRKLDFKFYFNYSYKKYVYALAVVWIAASPMCHNFSLICMWLFIRIIPFYIVLAYTDAKSKKTCIKL